MGPPIHGNYRIATYHAIHMLTWQTLPDLSNHEQTFCNRQCKLIDVDVTFLEASKFLIMCLPAFLVKQKAKHQQKRRFEML